MAKILSESSTDSPEANRTLKEKEINDLFEMLNLTTAADRDKFLRLERLSNESDLGQDRGAAPLRICFGDSTVSSPPSE